MGREQRFGAHGSYIPVRGGTVNRKQITGRDQCYEGKLSSRVKGQIDDA